MVALSNLGNLSNLASGPLKYIWPTNKYSRFGLPRRSSAISLRSSINDCKCRVVSKGRSTDLKSNGKGFLFKPPISLSTTRVLQLKSAEGNTILVKGVRLRQRFSTLRCNAALTQAMTLTGLQRKERETRWNLRKGWSMSRERVNAYTDWTKRAWVSMSLLLSMRLSSKWRAGTERQRAFHLFERMLVTIDCFVGRKERMWQSTASGKLLILSSITWNQGIGIPAMVKRSRLMLRETMM